MYILNDDNKDPWKVTCPNCGGIYLHKHGTYRNRQRFLCTRCKRIFTYLSKTVLDSTKIKEDTWQRLIMDTITFKTIKESSHSLGITEMTISKRRQQILKTLYKYGTTNQIFKEIISSSFSNQSPQVIYYIPYKNEQFLLLSNVRSRFYIKSYNSLMFDELKGYHNRFMTFIKLEKKTNQEAYRYFKSFEKALNGFRGVQKKNLKLYVNLISEVTSHSTTDLVSIITKNLFKI